MWPANAFSLFMPRGLGVATRESVCVCLSVVPVAMRRKLTASISHILLDFDSWICKLKLCSRVMTYSEGILCIVSSVRTNFLFNLWLSLAPKRLLLHDSAANNSSLTESSQPWPFCTIIIVRMRTQSHVCENPISAKSGNLTTYTYRTLFSLDWKSLELTDNAFAL